MLKLIAALLSVPAAGLALVASTGVMVVDVQEGGPGATRIVVPVPLLLAQAVASLAPVPAPRIDAPELERHLPAVEAVLDALAAAPDAELVRVEEPGERVVISKAGAVLQVRVRERGDEVAVDVPLRAARRVLRSLHGGRLDAAELIAALRSARGVRIADVKDGGDRVRITVW